MQAVPVPTKIKQQLVLHGAGPASELKTKPDFSLIRTQSWYFNPVIQLSTFITLCALKVTLFVMPMWETYLLQTRSPPDDYKILNNREVNLIEILILRDGEGEQNPKPKEKYKHLSNRERKGIGKTVFSNVKDFTDHLSSKLEALQIGRVGILPQPISLSLAYVIDKLFAKGVEFVVQVKKSLKPHAEPVVVMFVNSTCDPPELQEFREIPGHRVQEFVKEKHAMCLLYHKLCVPPPAILKTGIKLDNCETDFAEGEVERYMQYQREAPANLKMFKEIVAENKEKGLIFAERKDDNSSSIEADNNNDNDFATNSKNKDSEGSGQDGEVSGARSTATKSATKKTDINVDKFGQLNISPYVGSSPERFD